MQSFGPKSQRIPTAENTHYTVLLLMNVMLDFICVALPSCEEWETSEKFKMKTYVSIGNRTSDPLLSKLAP